MLDSDFVLHDDVEKYQNSTLEYKNHLPYIWANSMRLFSEKITEIIALKSDVNSAEFGDQNELLKHLREKGMLDDTNFRNLDKIRWVCNQIMHDTKKQENSDIVLAWIAFDELAESRFWKKVSATGHIVDDPIKELIDIGTKFFQNPKSSNGFTPKKALGAIKPIVQTAVAGAVMYGIYQHINSPEFKEQQRRESEQMKKFAFIFFGILGLLIAVLGILKLVKG